MIETAFKPTLFRYGLTPNFILSGDAADHHRGVDTVGGTDGTVGTQPAAIL